MCKLEMRRSDIGAMAKVNTLQVKIVLTNHNDCLLTALHLEKQSFLEFWETICQPSSPILINSNGEIITVIAKIVA